MHLLNSKWKFIDIAIAEVERADDVEEESIQMSSIPEVEKQQLVMARRGQGIFRGNLSKVETNCRVTGVSDTRFLIASHIKPWRLSSNEEKLDGYNGLLLSPHVDKLFDTGWISFSDDGNLLISDGLHDLLHAWGITATNVGPFCKQQQSYLALHRKMFGFDERE